MRGLGLSGRTSPLSPRGYATCFAGIAWREALRFFSQRGRFLSALVRPLVWLFIFAAWFRSSSSASRFIPPYETYVFYEVYVTPGLVCDDPTLQRACNPRFRWSMTARSAPMRDPACSVPILAGSLLALSSSCAGVFTPIPASMPPPLRGILLGGRRSRLVGYTSPPPVLGCDGPDVWGRWGFFSPPCSGSSRTSPAS